MTDGWLMPGIPRTIADDPDMEVVERIRESITSDTGQTVESDMLLPCPFCGGRPWVQVHELDETCVEARVVCAGCHVSTSREYQSWGVSFMGEPLTRLLAIGRAISSWNRRAERTCRIDMPVIDWETGETDYRCSVCGFSADPQDWAETYDYCPHCGARVVEE